MYSNAIDFITDKSPYSISSVSSTLNLLADGSTIPFIARYRKEATKNLDEVAIQSIQEWKKLYDELVARKIYIKKRIHDLDHLTPHLAEAIDSTWSLERLEDLYIPYKSKRKTRADKAREAGLEPLAKIIMAQQETNLPKRLPTFLNYKVESSEDAISGALDIIAEWINENTEIRDYLRKNIFKYGFIACKRTKLKDNESPKFKSFDNLCERVKNIPSHRYLALDRGEKLKQLKVKIQAGDERYINYITRRYTKLGSTTSSYIKQAVEESYNRLIFPSIANQLRNRLKEKSDTEAIKVFANNLEQLLLAPPLGQKYVLAIDPGFRTGCKCAILNDQGELIEHGVIYIIGSDEAISTSQVKVYHWLDKYPIEAIALGNGTASRETKYFLNPLLSAQVDLYMVNENGASIYSASEIARKEFPSLDITIRGAVSIGRRLMDPLSELVKIDPKSIGVGQYQHDVNPASLNEALHSTVLSCVNRIGINLNTASQHVLTYISGLGPSLAENIVHYRGQNGSFNSIKELLKVPRLGQKAFEQSSGFLRIKDGITPLDNTGIHPESYPIVEKIAKDEKVSLDNLLNNSALINSIDFQRYLSPTIGIETLKDIKRELLKPGIDPRGQATTFRFDEKIRKIDDVKVDMVLPGVITNLTKFGAFVDIGIKENGLIHISEIVNRYISDPAEVLSIDQKISSKVISIDIPNKRISLSMKAINN